MSADRLEIIDVSVTLDVPKPTTVDFTAFMMTRSHWAALWPDVRERWAWLSFMNRSGERVSSGTTPQLVCADGKARRWTFTKMKAGVVVQVAMDQAGWGRRLQRAM